MRPTVHSDGIENVEGRLYQKSSIQTTYEFYSTCPYCTYSNDVTPKDQLIKCENPKCGKTYYGEFDNTI